MSSDFSVEEPIFLNPCSIQSVACVFREIGKRAGIHVYGNGNRQWLVIVCDGKVSLPTKKACDDHRAEHPDKHID